MCINHTSQKLIASIYLLKLWKNYEKI